MKNGLTDREFFEFFGELLVAAELCRWLCTAGCTFGWKADGGSGSLVSQTRISHLGVRVIRASRLRKP